MHLVPLPASRFDEWWPHASPYARQMALRFPDDWPLAEIERQAKSEQLLLWMIWDGTTHYGLLGAHVFEKPSGRREMDIVLAGGREHRLWWQAGIEALEQEARNRGCSGLVIRGREAWARYLRDYDIRRDFMLVKELV